MTPETFSNPGVAGGAQMISTAQSWAGWIVSGFAVLFFLFDGVMKLVKPAIVVKTTVEVMGFPESSIQGMGIALLVCTGLYMYPRTAVLGAILLTGYLGGAIASQVRVSAPVFSVLFAAGFAILVWAGLWLRDMQVRAVIW